MSGAVIDLLYALAETPGIPVGVGFQHDLGDRDDGSAAETDFASGPSLEIGSRQTELTGADAIGLEPAEDGVSTPDQAVVLAEPNTPKSDPDLWLYRDRTVALLRRYMRLSIEVGRMPSLLGREFFRSRVTSYGSSTFEDSVIFVHDVERSLEELNEFEKKLIAKIVLQQFSKEEAGRLLGCGYRTVERLFPEALDRVSEILLKRGILTGLPGGEARSAENLSRG